MSSPESDAAQTTRTIVVGVDGSENSKAALIWAVDDAIRHGGRLRVVLAWHPSRSTQYDPAPRDRTQAWATVTRLLDAVPHAAVDVVPEVVEGLASAALIEAARDADLLVVGSLGVRAGRRTVLGSVSALCALRADCPVVVVPVGWRPGEPRAAVAHQRRVRP